MKRNDLPVGDNELQRLVEQISSDYFGRSFQHQALFNARLRTTGGRYLLHSHNIEINPKQFQYYGEEVLIGIIKHELCHYHLHIQGMGFKHRDHDFKYLMEEVGAPRYCNVIPGTANKSYIIHRYECLDCKLQYKRKRRINLGRYVCGKCQGKLNKL